MSQSFIYLSAFDDGHEINAQLWNGSVTKRLGVELAIQKPQFKSCCNPKLDFVHWDHESNSSGVTLVNIANWFPPASWESN